MGTYFYVRWKAIICTNVKQIFTKDQTFQVQSDLENIYRKYILCQHKTWANFHHTSTQKVSCVISHKMDASFEIKILASKLGVHIFLWVWQVNWLILPKSRCPFCALRVKRARLQYLQILVVAVGSVSDFSRDVRVVRVTAVKRDASHTQPHCNTRSIPYPSQIDPQ